ncbi:MAG TPA: glutaminase, partial [Thermomicrobiales bacterium]|nr:glutaminase [Thermomicrobiales bacterium]
MTGGNRRCRENPLLAVAISAGSGMREVNNEGDLREPFVSTGTLPTPDVVTSVLADTYKRHLPNRDGTVSTVYPALERVAPDLFGLALIGASGAAFEVGDAQVPFTIMSVSKPFVFALVCQELGPATA